MFTQIARQMPGLKAGDVVFVLITPATPNVFMNSYRPRPYFVLESKVEEVRPDNTYKFDTNFLVMPGRVFCDLQAAKKELTSVFAKETCGILPFERVLLVTSQEETDGQAAIFKEIHDQHSVARQRLAQN